MCLSFHDEDVLDPLDMQPQFMTVPEFGQNAYSTLLCIPQCVLHALNGFYDFTEQSMEYHLEEFDVVSGWVLDNMGGDEGVGGGYNNTLS